MALERSQRMRPSPTIPVRALGLLAALLLALPLGLAPRAEAFIYWGGGDAIGHANLDGMGVDQGFINALGLEGLAVDANHVYWSGCENPSCVPITPAIGRAKLDGSDANHSFITDTGRFTQGIAVDANHVYWTAADPPHVARANLDGTNVEPSFITMSNYQGIYERSDVAVDAHHVYWTQIEEPNGVSAIGRANLDGTNVERSFIPDTGGATDVAVDAEHIYWTAPSPYGAVIGRANLDGTNVEPSFITAAGGPRVTGVAVDANHVYWGHHTGYPSFFGAIGRASLDGTNVEPSFISGLGLRGGLAIDALTDPSPTSIRAKTTARRTQRQRGRSIHVKFKVKAKERLTAKATGRIKVNPTYKLKPKRVKLDAGEAKMLRLKPKKATAKKIARALKRGEKAKARLKVKLVDLAGNRETKRLRVGLRL